MSASLPDPAPLFSGAFQRDPYPTYAWHRKGPRVQPLAARPGAYMIFGFSDCVTLFRDARLSSQRPGRALIGPSTEEESAELKPFVEHMHRWLLLLDAPRHTQLRKALNPIFSPARIAQIRGRVQAIVDQLLDALESNPAPDLIRDFAYPLPVVVFCEILGLPPELYARCTELTNDIAAWVSNLLRGPAQSRIAYSAVIELEGYFADLVRQRRAHPQEDLISQLITIARDGGLSDQELYAQCIMMLFAGHETTRHLIGNGMYTLLAHPQSLQTLRADPRWVQNAVEEFLRFESPIQALTRVVKEDVDYEGFRLPAGSTLILMIGAAQRDPQQYADADRFDPHRQHIRHIGFGADAHTCLGAAMARLESQSAVHSIISRFPNLAMHAEEPDWGANFMIRGLKSLRVSLA